MDLLLNFWKLCSSYLTTSWFTTYPCMRFVASLKDSWVLFEKEWSKNDIKHADVLLMVERSPHVDWSNDDAYMELYPTNHQNNTMSLIQIWISWIAKHCKSWMPMPKSTWMLPQAKKKVKQTNITHVNGKQWANREEPSHGHNWNWRPYQLGDLATQKKTDRAIHTTN